MSTQSHYETLKVARDAPTDIITAAYFLLRDGYARSGESVRDAENYLRALDEAHGVLSNPYSRGAYDYALSRKQNDAGATEAIIGNSLIAHTATTVGNLLDATAKRIRKEAKIVAANCTDEQNLKSAGKFFKATFELACMLAFALMLGILFAAQ